MSTEALLAHLREQMAYCQLFGSPFTAELCERFAEDLEAGGPTADLIGGWAGNPRGDAVALRLAGALHAAVLMGKDAALAAAYPAAKPDWRMAEVWPLARAFLAREHEWVAAFITSPPQTNETRRSIALLAGFLAFAAKHGRPVDMLELGASAGLNLNWDRFRYETPTWVWGPESSVLITNDWNAPVPHIEAPLVVRRRAACDVNPLNISDPQQRLQLRSYVWPDQPDRLARFDGAVELALKSPDRVERADAGEWIARKLAERDRSAPLIVYHSVFLQYPPRETQQVIQSAIEAAGAVATDAGPLAWVRLEPEELIDGVKGSPRMVADMITWPGGERRVLGHTDGHVRAFYGV
ncbi:MAG: DUF2332 domain-containing protein [Hyphomonadaceae bacterium]|nr:DUF2332 domain-containing protein [Hyphomonadaceae bacterium]